MLGGLKYSRGQTVLLIHSKMDKDTQFKETHLSKRRNRAANAQQVIPQAHFQDNTINIESYRPHKQRQIHLTPKTLTQETYLDLLTDPAKTIVFATGPAGTGKTMLAVLAALKAYRNGECSKIVITRPAVGVDDEKHGFLPGDINAKMEPWTKPILDYIEEYYRPSEVAKMLDEKVIELAPLAFQRGRTFRNTWVIFDEAQNSSINQMKMILTRLGENSKMVVTGDLQQTDRQFSKESGLIDFIERLQKSNSNLFGYVAFNGKDSQRSAAVREVLKLYGEV